MLFFGDVLSSLVLCKSVKNKFNDKMKFNDIYYNTDNVKKRYQEKRFQEFFSMSDFIYLFTYFSILFKFNVVHVI